MKKIFLIFIMFLGFVGIVNAQNCQVKTGTGTNFGDEVTCGTESFYVIDYNEDTTKLLAKYNLYVGDTINFFEADENAPRDIPQSQYYEVLTTEKSQEYCTNLAKSKGHNPYYVVAFIEQSGTSYSNYTYTLNGCRTYERIEYEHVRQDERAIGTTFKSDGTSYYPQVGITYMRGIWGYDYIHDKIEYKNEYNGPVSVSEYCEDNPPTDPVCRLYNDDPSKRVYGDLIIEGSSFEQYINGYKDELERQNIIFKDVDFLHLSGFKDIYKRITNEDLYLKFTYGDRIQYGEQNVDYLASGKLPLIDKIPEEYKWLYATTFWLGSGSLWETEIQESNSNISEYNDYYFTTEGILCSLGRGTCQYTDIPIGGGVRPVLTINNEYIKPAASEENTAKEDQKEEKKEQKNPKTADIAISLLFIALVLSTGIMIYTKKRLKEIG